MDMLMSGKCVLHLGRPTAGVFEMNTSFSPYKPDQIALASKILIHQVRAKIEQA
jgi:hypothetical protein